MKPPRRATTAAIPSSSSSTAATKPPCTPDGGPFNRQTLEILKPIVLDGIDGYGIRSISYDPYKGGFWLLTGGSAKKGKNRFGLWFWRFFNETTTNGQLLRSSVFFEKTIGTAGESYKLHPEGVYAVRTPPSLKEFLLIVTDGSPYYFKANFRSNSGTAPAQ